MSSLCFVMFSYFGAKFGCPILLLCTFKTLDVFKLILSQNNSILK